jgi:hypothetical protein
MSRVAAAEEKQVNLGTLQTERLAYVEPVSVHRGGAA